MNLNLSRKWRSKNFDTIAGQELSIKMLKNSLYLGQFFPVYLFSGQRGCGKTTTARVFAAAVNCAELNAFQKNPKRHQVPCLQCASCLAMAQGNHPDFIEMDAASHTGVDDVRAIIEAAALLPVLGMKKVYLIDEAHMLSKAAFNALLKILEEPPRSVLFILATTDPHKIIDTVMSRCFHLVFKAVGPQPLLAHLQAVCVVEQIRYAPGGLEQIIQATEGSVRDALNLVEQVRFSSGTITPDAVRSVLGRLSDEQALRLFEIILHKSAHDFLLFMQSEHLARFSAATLWQTLTELVRAALWVRHGIVPPAYTDYHAQLQQLVMSVPIEQLHALAQSLYEHEQLFMRTTAQHELIEFLLLRMCKQTRSNDTPGTAGIPSSPAQGGEVQAAPVFPEQEEESDEIDKNDEEDSEEDTLDDAQSRAPWDLYLVDLEQIKDPLLSSIFTQGTFVAHRTDSGELEVQFSKELVFFKDWLEDTKKSWQPLLQKHFGATVSFVPLFTGTRAPEKKATVENSQQGQGIAGALGTANGIKAVVEQKQRGAGREAHKNANPTSSMQHTGNRSFESAKPASAKSGWQKNTSWNNHQGGRQFGGHQGHASYQRSMAPKGKPERGIDISDAALWKKATMLVQYFPGTVTEVEEKMEGVYENN
jgi:DNA polymerase-3 subunit gamma/tau